MKGLPYCYAKDSQESWEPMLDSVEFVSDSLGIANGVIATLTVRPERMRAALDMTMLATDVAEWLVKKGVPFREAHHISGRIVALSENTEVSMDQLTLEQLQAIDSRFTADIAAAFEYESSVEAKSALGGTSRSAVLGQIQELRAILD
jgi:argininosuccinate lyase